MPRLLAAFTLRLLVCGAVAYGLWRVLGPIGLAASAPVFGITLAKPLFELVAEFGHAARGLAYADLAGRHFEHRGFALDIRDDEHHHRWLSTRDVRKVIRALPREAVLQRQFPEGVRLDPGIRGHRISADALMHYLSKSTHGDSVRFRNWLEREVVLPAANIRRRLGVVEADAGPEVDDRQ